MALFGSNDNPRHTLPIDIPVRPVEKLKRRKATVVWKKEFSTTTDIYNNVLKLIVENGQYTITLIDMNDVVYKNIYIPFDNVITIEAEWSEV